eukprot:6541600-Prymnesium_polylepis.1
MGLARCVSCTLSTDGERGGTGSRQQQADGSSLVAATYRHVFARVEGRAVAQAWQSDNQAISQSANQPIRQSGMTISQPGMATVNQAWRSGNQGRTGMATPVHGVGSQPLNRGQPQGSGSSGAWSERSVDATGRLHRGSRRVGTLAAYRGPPMRSSAAACISCKPTASAPPTAAAAAASAIVAHMAALGVEKCGRWE